MKRLLQVKNGIAVGEWSGGGGLPVPPDGSWVFVDVTNRPTAKLGMAYNANTDTFTSVTAAKFPSAMTRLIKKTGA